MRASDELRGRLANALSASGYEVAPADNSLTPLVEKLELLQKTDRYGGLLRNLLAANKRDNLRSFLLEVTFAFQFETAALPLQYEVRRRQDDETSVDFLRRTSWGKALCIEMRLVQQPQARADLFERQSRESYFYRTTLDGTDDRAETLRLQRCVFEKAINRDGGLTKFSPDDADSYNIVAIEVSELQLGMIDYHDCMLVAYGDPAVPNLARRALFGLFQESRLEYPSHIQEVAARFAAFRDVGSCPALPATVPT